MSTLRNTILSVSGTAQWLVRYAVVSDNKLQHCLTTKREQALPVTEKQATQIKRLFETNYGTALETQPWTILNENFS